MDCILVKDYPCRCIVGDCPTGCIINVMTETDYKYNDADFEFDKKMIDGVINRLQSLYKGSCE